MHAMATGSSPDVDPGPAVIMGEVAHESSDFEAFVAGVLPKMFRLASSLGATRADAEDVASEALARAYASWGRVGAMEYRDGWVLRTTTNLLYDRTRRRTRGEPGGPTVVLAGFEQGVVDRAVLVDALRRLSARQRQAVVLHHLAGLRINEVSQAMRASPNSVKKYLARGMAGLRAQLGDLGEEQSDV
jgi:DNA-directed RNA polymerase specialized sigma24 family protein